MTTNDVSRLLTAMVRRRPPVPEVVGGSTPVVAFGNPFTAEVATLGINPSKREFVERGSILQGSRRRLATLESLGASDTLHLSDEQVSTVVADCAAYFDGERNPYRRWFDRLDRVLRGGLGVSYYNGSACHLDLVQWATDPIWGKLPERTRYALLEDGVPHRRAQLAHGNTRLVLLNGRQVIDQVSDIRLAPLTAVDSMSLGKTTCTLVTGQNEGATFIGWSANLQSSWGVSTKFATELAAWLSNTARERHGARATIGKGEV